MYPSSLKPPPCPIPYLLTKKGNNSQLTCIQIKSCRGYPKRLFFYASIIRCLDTPDDSNSRKQNINISSVSCLTETSSHHSLSMTEKVHYLAAEFKSIPKPIDRVKRLLHYASILPPFDQSARIQENRVMGCSTMVWLEVAIEENRVMRFRLDSDSEITKGFSSCLVWLFDGAAPEEVLSVKTDDLVDMNVGFQSRGRSRVHTWHNILISMQRRTQKLVEERDAAGFSKDFHCSSFDCKP